MITFDAPAKLTEWIENVMRSAYNSRADMATYFAKCRCYYSGIQWLNQTGTPAAYLRLSRDMSNWVGESGPIRATVNETTTLILSVTATTKPYDISVDAEPSEYAADISGLNTAQLIESAANTFIDDSGLLEVARTANEERTVCGAHCIGVRIVGNRGQRRLEAYDFDSTKLTVDPANNNKDLRRHEYVIQTEILTIDDIERDYPDAARMIDRKKLQKIGVLLPAEMEYYTLSGGTLYASYAAESETLGARCHKIYLKGPDGRRFDRCYVSIEAETPTPLSGTKPATSLLHVNYDNPANPFAGDGLPIVELRGHPRPKSRVPISDVGKLFDAQDKLNTLFSLLFQQIYNYTSRVTWLADARWFGKSASDANAIAAALNSRVVVGMGDPSAERPTLINQPAPSGELNNLAREYADDMRRYSSRTDANVGNLKTHQTTSNFNRAQELAELPLDDRTSDDAERYAQIIGLIASTAISLLSQQEPSIAVSLIHEGFTEVELGTLATRVNPMRMPAQLRLRNQSLRHRSRSTRRQDLFDLVQLQAIDARTLRQTLANELNMPISALDKQLGTWSNRTALSVMRGEPYSPIPLGQYAGTLIDSLTMALTSPETAKIPGASERLSDAIEAQTIYEVQRLPPQQGAAPATEDTGPEEVRLQDLLAPSIG